MSCFKESMHKVKQGLQLSRNLQELISSETLDVVLPGSLDFEDFWSPNGGQHTKATKSSISE